MTQQEINGIAHEVAFWMRFANSERFTRNWLNPSGNPELEPEIKELVEPYLETGKVLDVGSGPVSILHGLFPDDHITAADPLGKFYETIVNFPLLRLQPPVSVKGEDLLHHFEPHSFDVIHMRNALDHTERPERVIQQFVSLKKKGGIIIIHGFENEGDHENWQGLHQWNIEATEEGIKISNQKTTIAHFKGKSFRIERYKKPWIFFVL